MVIIMAQTIKMQPQKLRTPESARLKNRIKAPSEVEGGSISAKKKASADFARSIALYNTRLRQYQERDYKKDKRKANYEEAVEGLVGASEKYDEKLQSTAGKKTKDDAIATGDFVVAREDYMDEVQDYVGAYGDSEQNINKYYET
jgi:hypothetical protein